MEIEKQSKKNGKRLRPEEEEKPQESGVKKDLLRLERDIFELKKAEEGDSQYVIRKLMAKKQKPQIGMINQSPLLSRLKQLMPVFHKSNEQLLQRPIQQSQKIDVQLQQCESSSSSSDSEDDDTEEKQEEMKEKVRSKIQDMDIEQTNNSSSHSEMQHQAEEAEVNEVQINFLRYPYLNKEMLAQLEKEKLNKPKQEEKKQQKQKKKVLIEQIPEQK